MHEYLCVVNNYKMATDESFGVVVEIDLVFTGSHLAVLSTLQNPQRNRPLCKICLRGKNKVGCYGEFIGWKKKHYVTQEFAV